MPFLGPRARQWRSWLSRHCTPTTVVLVGGALALLVAASDYRDHQQAQRDTHRMYRELVDGGTIEKGHQERAANTLAGLDTLSQRSMIRLASRLCVIVGIGLLLVRLVRRSAALQAARLSAARLRGVISSIDEGMFVTRPDGRVESWNDAAVRATGVQQAAILNQPLAAALPAFAAALAGTRQVDANAGRPSSTTS